MNSLLRKREAKTELPLTPDEYERLNRLLRKGDIDLLDLEPEVRKGYIRILSERVVKKFPLNEVE